MKHILTSVTAQDQSNTSNKPNETQNHNTKNKDGRVTEEDGWTKVAEKIHSLTDATTDSPANSWFST